MWGFILDIAAKVFKTQGNRVQEMVLAPIILQNYRK